MSSVKVKNTLKDSVFRNLFTDPVYALELYKALHPEDQSVTIADIDNVTITNVFTDQEYNDLGMLVRNRLLIMLEAQSTWTENILIRIVLYLAHVWNEWLEASKQNRYSSKNVELPYPELYVLYTGNRKERPEWMDLAESFFEGRTDFLNVRVRVLYGDQKNTIINQYVLFTRIYNEQVRSYGRTQQAVLETIRICEDENVLSEYLRSHEMEVVDIMMALFDQEKIMDAFIAEKEREIEKEVTERVTIRLINELTERVTDEVTQKVTDEVTQKVTDEVTQKVTDEVTQKVTDEVTQKVTDEVTQKVTDEVTQKVKIYTILELVRDGEYSEEKAARKLGVSRTKLKEMMTE